MKLLRPYTEAELATRISAAKANAPEGSTPEELAKIEESVRTSDNPDYKVYFKVNDGTSVTSSGIKPDALRDPADDPFELTIDINRVDSGRSWTKAAADSRRVARRQAHRHAPLDGRWRPADHARTHRARGFGPRRHGDG
jgi:hypothetical protein